MATSREAERRGVAAGMALAEARALAADLLALPRDDEQIARAALEVTTALLAASPRVAWAREPDGVWWVDAGGLGDEQRLARRLLAIAKRLGYGPARVGIAESAIAAYAATFLNPLSARPPDPPTACVPSGRDAEFLAPFPLALLDLDDDLADTFSALGLTTLGRLAALEAGEVEARFGPDGLAAHRLARGLDPRGPTTPRDDALPVIEVELGGPVATAEPLLFVLRGALAALGEALRAKGLTAREVALALHLDDGSTHERAVRPARPTSQADALFDHCRSALEAWRLPEPVTGLAVRAAVTVPASGEQGELLTPRWADPAVLEAAFDRIRGREGNDAVVVPELRDGHLPEDGGAWAIADRGGRRGGDEAAPRRAPDRGPGRALTGRSPAQPRPDERKAAALRRLDTPVAVRVRLGRSGLEAFRYDDLWHDVTAWSGPERLAPRWWRGEAPAGPRDYYTARASDGALWLLFRAASSRQWFVEGWWD